MQALANRYQSIDVTTARKETIILLAYEGAMKFVSQAKNCLERGDIAGKGEKISRSIAIIGELNASLNLEAGGDIAANLEALYSYMTTRLLEANVKSDPRILDEVLSLLRTLYEGWVEATGRPDVSAAKEKSMAPVMQQAAWAGR